MRLTVKLRRFFFTATLPGVPPHSNVSGSFSFHFVTFHSQCSGKISRDPDGLLGSLFAGYVPLASQSPNSIIVDIVAYYRPHLCHF